MWRIFWVFVAIQSFGLATIIGVVVLARSISSIRRLALDHNISIGLKESQQPFSPYQPITMGAEGLMVGSAMQQRWDNSAEHLLRNRD